MSDRDAQDLPHPDQVGVRQPVGDRDVVDRGAEAPRERRQRVAPHDLVHHEPASPADHDDRTDWTSRPVVCPEGSSPASSKVAGPTKSVVTATSWQNASSVPVSPAWNEPSAITSWGTRMRQT